MKASPIVAVLLVLATGSLAAPPQEPAAPETPQPERKICHTTKVTGSLTRRARVCLTEAQWREVHNRTRRGLDEFVGDASGGCQSPGGMGGTMCGG